MFIKIMLFIIFFYFSSLLLYYIISVSSSSNINDPNLYKLYSYENKLSKLTKDQILFNHKYYKLLDTNYTKYNNNIQLYNNKNFELFKNKNKNYFQSCPYNFKIYVYDLPDNHSGSLLAEHARNQTEYNVCNDCNYSQFSLEFVINDFFLQFCGRTTNPDEADFFYLPVIKDTEYRYRRLNLQQFREPSLTEYSFIDAIENQNFNILKNYFDITDKYLKRRGGYDHIVIIVTPVSAFYHTSTPYLTHHFLPLLTNFIYFNIEYSRGFYNYYKNCLDYKNLLLPYPVIKKEFYSGNNVNNIDLLYKKLKKDIIYDPIPNDTSVYSSIISNSPFYVTISNSSYIINPYNKEYTTNYSLNSMYQIIKENDNEYYSFLFSDEHYNNNPSEHNIEKYQNVLNSFKKLLISRPFLFYYSGFPHGSCPFVRFGLNSIKDNSTRIDPYYTYNLDIKNREQGFMSSTFCIIPIGNFFYFFSLFLFFSFYFFFIGDSASSNRMFEALSYGCIPVLLSDEIVWPFTDVIGGYSMKESEFTIRLPQSISYYHHSYYLKDKKEIYDEINNTTTITSTRKEEIFQQYQNDMKLFEDLPVSKKNTLDILRESYKLEEEKEKNNEIITEVTEENGKQKRKIYLSPLVRILEKIPIEDIYYLRKNAIKMSFNYHFYQVSESYSEIPIHATRR